jgi:uncharacterized protein YjbJ (UPF0337 family)
MYANEQIAELRGNIINRLDEDAKGVDMNRDRFRGVFEQIGGSVKERWGALTGDPRIVAAGKRSQISGRVEEQRGIARQRAERQLEDFMRRNRNWQDLSQH